MESMNKTCIEESKKFIENKYDTRVKKVNFHKLEKSDGSCQITRDEKQLTVNAVAFTKEHLFVGFALEPKEIVWVLAKARSQELFINLEHFYIENQKLVGYRGNGEVKVHLDKTYHDRPATDYGRRVIGAIIIFAISASLVAYKKGWHLKFFS